MYLWQVDVDVRQKPTQYCKANIFQLKIDKKKFQLSLSFIATKSEYILSGYIQLLQVKDTLNSILVPLSLLAYIQERSKSVMKY